jgi:Ca2+-binding RTX toxin-like protein
MANGVFLEGNRYTRDTTWLVQYYGAQKPTNFEMLDSNGVLRVSQTGVNFTYASNGFFDYRTIYSELLFASNGKLTRQRTNLNVDVATRNSLLTVGTSGQEYNQYVCQGNDNFLGSAGDDFLPGSKGNDTINGGAGIDLLGFGGLSEGVTVNLSTGRAITSYGTSVISNVEDIEGSGYGDVLTGNSGNNEFQGWAAMIGLMAVQELTQPSILMLVQQSMLICPPALLLAVAVVIP